eukprot:CAMPEP_0115032066 /NCGR_PEP_ID=MMETSP0216-20121206/38935_1 /TAXON_ID=223996 /ORGANISM="Protocruzia adherens, Strain Boccale" /LENGTH=404 /DNA_ID=CAMNT_0002409891 /DNA_START=530 /DNA_END=1744 /DNA_ORIENTATION=+
MAVIAIRAQFAGWDWSATFWAYWVAFAVLVLFSLGVTLLCCGTSCSFVMGNSTAAEFTSTFWIFYMVTGFTLSSFLMIRKLVDFFDGKATLDEALDPPIIYLGFFVVLSIFCFKNLPRWWDSFFLNDTDMQVQPADGQPIQNESSIPLANTLTQLAKAPPRFLVRFSSSYFQRPDRINNNDLKDMKFENIAPVKEGAIKKPHHSRHLSNATLGAPKKREFGNSHKPLAQLDLEIGDVKKPKAESDADETSSKLPVTRKKQRRGLSIDFNSLYFGEPRNSNRTPKVETMKSVHHSRQSSTVSYYVNGKMCTICCDQEPDSVILECGHGGICYNCALELWRSTGECHLCREAITQVLQIDTTEKDSNFIKVLTSTHTVPNDEEVPFDDTYEIIDEHNIQADHRVNR